MDSYRSEHARAALLKLLNELGLVNTTGDASEFFSRSDGILKALANENRIDEQLALSKIAEKLRLELVELPSEIPPEVTASLKSVPQELLLTGLCAPYKIDSRGFHVAFANPLDFELVKSLQLATGASIIVELASEGAIRKLLGKITSGHASQFDDLENLDLGASVEILSGPPSQDWDPVDDNRKPVIQLVNKLIVDAVRARASDLHVEPSSAGICVRFRVDGVMRDAMEIPKRLQAYVLSRLKLMSGMDIAERRRPQDGRIRVKVDGMMLDLRASAVPSAYGENLVLRILTNDSDALTFDRLGIPAHLQVILKNVLDSPGKMLLVTGPTGSGKTTTLYAGLNAVRDGTLNVVTVEDPIEYRFQGITQIQINEAIGVTFASALRAVLRQDPDVMLIGEIRDQETMRIAVQAANTGHLVLSTLHTNDAPSAITRLLDLGAEPSSLATSLAGILGQRLVRSLCPACATNLDANDLAAIECITTMQQRDLSRAKKAVGCDRCSFSGYQGRSGIYSYMEVNHEVATLIARRASEEVIVRVADAHGFKPLSDAAIELFLGGITSYDEISSYISKTTVEGSVPQPKPTEVKAVSSEEYTAKVSTSSFSCSSFNLPQILLIDDDDNICTVFSEVLSKECYSVTVAHDGRSALEKLSAGIPDLILLDLMMPEMGGKEFLKRLRSQSAGKKVPVLVFTAFDNDEREVELLDLGATDFISKTSSAQVMLARIRKHLSAAS